MGGRNNQMRTAADRIAATIAIIFSVLSFIEGMQVALKISIPDYIVFTPLLVYNILMSVVGVLGGIQIFRRNKNAIRYSVVITLSHISTLASISFLYLFDSYISMHSLTAMIIRSSIWLIITITLLVNYRNNHEQKEKI